MGRKKVLGANEAPEVAESTPFCYYCDREFDDVKTLVHHQRTKHFCCGECGRTFGSVTSLRVHMLNSYKKSLKEVPHAMSGRENPDVVVHGMDGIPQDILEERIQKSKADADDKREEEKERSKGAPKVDPSSPASKSLPPTALPSTSPEPQSGQKQAAASPETGNTADLPLEPPTPSQKLEEDVDAAVTSLPPALKLLVPELLEETPQCEGLPDALASLHSIAVQALASFGLLQPGSYGANKMDAALQAAVAAVKQPIKPIQAQPAMTDVSATLGPTVSLPVGFVPPVAAQPASQPLRPLGPAPMGCFPTQFPPMQGPMASLGPGPSAVPNRPNTPGAMSQARPPGYVPSPQTMACGCAAQPMQLPFGVMGMGMPAVGGRQIGGAPTMPLVGGIALPTQLPSGIAGMEPAEKRAKVDVA